MPIDPILSVLVAFIILRSASKLVYESGHILLEGSPFDVDVRAITDDLVMAVDAVEDVHHVHVWSITQERRMATLHARIRPGSKTTNVVAAIKDRLKDEFGIGHATIEIKQRDELI